MNSHSQFEEDLIVADVFRQIGITYHRCVEVGADDGLELSNTLAFRETGEWTADLIEANWERYQRCLSNTEDEDRTVVTHASLSAATVNNVIRPEPGIDLLSLDVDGDEWFILHDMKARPRVLIVEFNQSIPWWMAYRPLHPGSRVGASAMALDNLLRSMGYAVWARTDCNLIYVTAAESVLGPDAALPVGRGTIGWRAPGLEHLFSDPDNEQALTYLATDYDGRPVLFGRAPAWGLVDEPCAEALVFDEWRDPDG